MHCDYHFPIKLSFRVYSSISNKTDTTTSTTAAAATTTTNF